MSKPSSLAVLAILSASLVTLVGCGDDDGGDSDDAGSGGAAGSGGKATGGGAGMDGGGDAGAGGTMAAAPTCADDTKNGDETDVDCGGPDCDPCAAESACSEASDCESGVCTDDECAAAECGDGVKNGDEGCDDGEETAACNADCTPTSCGDGYVNAEAEICERPNDAEPWHRCNTACGYGVLLDGTWSTTNLGDTDSPWEVLAPASDVTEDKLAGFQSFHYTGQPAIFDLTVNYRYDIEDDAWVALEEALPYQIEYWENGAVDSAYIWVPREGKMHRFEMSSETWETLEEDVPDGSSEATAAVFDGEGFIWYHGSDNELVRYDPSDGGFEVFSHAADFLDFDVYETRIAYDPLSNQLVFTGYQNDRFLIFDIEEETFTESAVSPGGGVSDNSCQDRAGGIYVGSQTDAGKMYRYDIADDEFTELPALPEAHDDNTSCVVSEDGYLYFITSEVADGEFFRLKLNLAE